MKTKQIISIALMLALLVSVITGCGTKEEPSTNNNEESTSAVSSEIKENEESKSGSKTANYAQTECQFRYCGTAIPFLTVRSTAR